MLERLKYSSCMFIAFKLPLLAILNWYYIVDIHFQVLSFQVVDLLAEADGGACIIGPYLVYQHRGN